MEKATFAENAGAPSTGSAPAAESARTPAGRAQSAGDATAHESGSQEAKRRKSDPAGGRDGLPEMAPGELYINRELSLLQFQLRVLEEAQDDRNPPLERVKYLAILGSNLDEFFMVRVGGLILQKNAGLVELSLDGLLPAAQLAAIRKLALKIMLAAHACWQDDLLPALDAAGIHVLDIDQLSDKQRAQVDEYFHEVVFSVLTPLAFDPGHPFPHISNRSLNLAVQLRDDLGHEHFARLKVPAILPRLVPLKRSSGSVRKDGTVPHNHYFVWLEQVIAHHLHDLFPGMKVDASHLFHVTRNAEIAIQELEASDLLATMKENVQEREFGDVVRMLVNPTMPAAVSNILVENLDMDHKDVYTVPGPLGLGSLGQLHDIDRYDLKYPAFAPTLPARLAGQDNDSDIFASIREGDILVHNPYDSFDTVLDFLKAAVRDPNVLAIKQTLYRVGSQSPVVKYLLEARREHRKQVAVLVELKARFDEESNISWARMLEKEGVHVVYGLLGLKTHSKILLVVRQEGQQIRRYVHLGTGNYNHQTARVYEDLGLLTCRDDFGADATDLFNYLTGYSNKKEYRKLLVAPINMRERIEALIQREIEHQRAGRSGHIIFKLNSLVDKRIIQLLYHASQAGVQIDLLVRGMCCLRPGLAGLSENVRVVSIVGRFLEHSRIFYFLNADQQEIYLGSADLMPRNIDRRVEVLFPVEDQQLVQHLRREVLHTYLSDNVRGRLMLPDGTYRRLQPGPGQAAVDCQDRLLRSHLPAPRQV